ncbi:hypothetical protein GUJ93_ZPchr0014g47066 [Zizania palustris]|uniref:Uncharacterized protein n=1 Tax=Zizania palustris TaxID=103762 RepID=A0A8J5W6Q9_ZIZPA|nr:hypothetical protein GUJ93_ZPchr0014g47066 [Zizania palustris]
MQSEHGGRLQGRGLGWQGCGQGGNRQIWAWWRATLEGLGFRRARESTSNAARRAPPCKALGRASPSLCETLPSPVPPAAPPSSLSRHSPLCWAAVDADNAPWRGWPGRVGESSV